MRTRAYVFLVFTLLLIPLAFAQDGGGVIEPIDDAMVNPDANISFPPPVYVARDSLDIRGTANLPNTMSYLIEFRPLVLDDMGDVAQDEALWFPAILRQRTPVVDGILGTWNTLTARDGLYELRMTIETSDGSEYVRVSPIRVENDPPDFVEEAMAEATEMAEEPEPTATVEPVVTVDDTKPRVVALVNSNVRAGDSTSYQIVGFLLEGETADIRGVSSQGTGWFFIQLESGVNGFIHPNIVQAEGKLSGLALISPPPLPPTPIPLPTAIPAAPVSAPAPAPATGPDLVFAGVQVAPHPPQCREAYQITVTVRNAGNSDASSGGLVEVRDSLQADGRVLGTTQIAFGPLAAGASQTVVGHLTMNLYYDEAHNVNLYLDVNSQVAETNENNNHHADAPYILQRGDC